MPQPKTDQAVFGISVAAQLTGIAVQTLRLYEARGLIQPARTEGRTRLYSADDLERARHIASLVEAGLNLAGIARVLELEEQNAQLQAENDEHRRPSAE